MSNFINKCVLKDDRIMSDKNNGIKPKYIVCNSFDGIDRKEIQDMTWEKHSHKNWKDTFANAIDMTIEKFKNDRYSNPYIK
jgi:beta-galactosidase GanA